jgi:hypothetical protein
MRAPLLPSCPESGDGTRSEIRRQRRARFAQFRQVSLIAAVAVLRDEVVVTQQYLMARFGQWAGFANAGQYGVPVSSNRLRPSRAEPYQKLVALKPSWHRHVAHVVLIAAPGPRFQRIDHLCP